MASLVRGMIKILLRTIYNETRYSLAKSRTIHSPCYRLSAFRRARYDILSNLEQLGYRRHDSLQVYTSMRICYKSTYVCNIYSFTNRCRSTYDDGEMEATNKYSWNIRRYRWHAHQHQEACATRSRLLQSEVGLQHKYARSAVLHSTLSSSY